MQCSFIERTSRQYFAAARLKPCAAEKVTKSPHDLQQTLSTIILLIYYTEASSQTFKKQTPSTEYKQTPSTEYKTLEMAGGGSSNKSQLSVASLRESASKLPRRKAFHWVAQWFTVPQLTTKILSFVSIHA